MDGVLSQKTYSTSSGAYELNHEGAIPSGLITRTPTDYGCCLVTRTAKVISTDQEHGFKSVVTAI